MADSAKGEKVSEETGLSHTTKGVAYNVNNLNFTLKQEETKRDV